MSWARRYSASAASLSCLDWCSLPRLQQASAAMLANSSWPPLSKLPIAEVYASSASESLPRAR
eukprot:scaffold368_cov258-Pinguiococcus_pyrenoidosus.AAC.2